MNRLLEGKRGLIFGVANARSIAWGIAEACHQAGAKMAFTYLNEALEKRVRPLAESLGSDLIFPCDVQDDASLDQVFGEVQKAWGGLDFLVHAVAYASGDELKNPFHMTSREGFRQALDISAYSLVAMTQRAVPLMQTGGSVVALSYLGAAQVVPNYRVMGVAKAALESCVRELAVDLGSKSIRVNAISAGPIKTLAASGIANFKALLTAFEDRAPLDRLTTIEDVGKSGVYLLSDLSGGVTGEVHYVDCGFNVTAA